MKDIKKESALSVELPKRQKEKKKNGEKEGKLQHSGELWNSRVLQYSFWWEGGEEIGKCLWKKWRGEREWFIFLQEIWKGVKTETGVLLCFQSYISITFSLQDYESCEEREREMDLAILCFLSLSVFFLSKE